MTVISHHEIVFRRRINVLAGVVLAIIAAAIYAVGRLTGSGAFDSTVSTL